MKLIYKCTNNEHLKIFLFDELNSKERQENRKADYNLSGHDAYISFFFSIMTFCHVYNIIEACTLEKSKLSRLMGYFHFYLAFLQFERNKHNKRKT